MLVFSVREIETVSGRFRVALGDATQSLHGRITLELARFLRAATAPDEVRDQSDDGTMCLAPIGGRNAGFPPRFYEDSTRIIVAAAGAVDLLLT